jgi:signal peptidase I
MKHMDNDFILNEFQDVETAPRRVSRPAKRPKIRKPKPVWREYAEVILIALVAAIVLRFFVVSAYRVDSASMEDTLLEGDYIFVNKLAYYFGEPKVGDIIVFKYPLNPTRDFIKRIIAVPGQTVEIIDKVVYVDNQLADILPNVKNTDPKVMPAQLSARDNFGPILVRQGEYFVLGDNRDDSQDSRVWGMLPERNIKGRALFVYWSWIPEDSAPEWEAPYVHSPFEFAFYFLTGFPGQTRWDRLLTAL